MTTRRLHYETLIAAPREQVWRTMLEPGTYRAWTSAFAEGSYYEGGWERGDRIRFLGPGGSGITSVIEESRPFEFLSIRHLGEIRDGVEDMESEAVRAWTPAFENYTFEDEGGSTRLKIDLDTTPEWETAMNDAWPKGLGKLKELAESHRG